MSYFLVLATETRFDFLFVLEGDSPVRRRGLFRSRTPVAHAIYRTA